MQVYWRRFATAGGLAPEREREKQRERESEREREREKERRWERGVY